MNFHPIAKLLGLLLVSLAASMIPALLFGLYYADGSSPAIGSAMLVTVLMGASLYFFGSLRRQKLFHREALAVVGLGWFLCAFAGALPYHFYGCFDTFADCYFESMSGFTTTGSSIVAASEALPNGIESLPRGILFWRSFTHWLGGMGIVVLFVALLPFLGAGGFALFKSETPGPVKESLTPRVKETAKILWALYVLLTLVETALLMGLGMNLHEALCHAFGTMATGGYSTRNASIAAFDSTAIHLVIIVFMFLAATNFSLYYRFIKDRRRFLWRDREWRAYALLIGVGAGLTAIVLVATKTYGNPLLAARDALFQVVSIMTTTGYATADFDKWPTVVKVLLVALMFVGGCAGSTGGGIKVIRVVILIRAAEAALERVYSPRTVRKVRVGGAVLSDDLQLAVLTFFVTWIAIFVGGTFAVALLEGDIGFPTAMTSVAATLNNIGPGLELVGATGNYAFFSTPSKWLLSLFMVLGRLELYTILVLFAPRFWMGR